MVQAALACVNAAFCFLLSVSEFGFVFLTDAEKLMTCICVFVVLEVYKIPKLMYEVHLLVTTSLWLFGCMTI